MKAVPYGRLGLSREDFDVRGQAIHAASVAGFRGKVSTLNTKKIIEDALPNAERLTLGFGQVDLELGYYYRLIVKQEEGLEEQSYVKWLVGIYQRFISDLLSNCSIPLVIKGANATVLSTPFFTQYYVSRIISDGKGSKQQWRRKLESCLLSEDQQNKMTYDFNAQMKSWCSEHGVGYFDVNSGICDPKTGRVRLEFHRAQPDHHLTDSLYVRKLHLDRLKHAFEEIS